MDKESKGTLTLKIQLPGAFRARTRALNPSIYCHNQYNTRVGTVGMINIFNPAPQEAETGGSL